MKYHKYIHTNTVIVLLYQEVCIVYVGLSMSSHLMLRLLIIIGGIIHGYSIVKVLLNFNEMHIQRYLIAQSLGLLIGIVALTFLVFAWEVKEIFPDWFLNSITLLAGLSFVSIVMLFISLYFQYKKRTT